MGDVINGVSGQYKIDASDCFWCLLDNRHKLNKDDIQNDSGVYVFWDWNDKPIRIGKAKKLRNRIQQYGKSPQHYDLLLAMQNDIQYVSVIYVNDIDNRMVEVDLLKQHKPKFNVVDI